MKKLHIAMVHDLVCSWCPIAYNNIKAAITNLDIDVDFSFLPFELNPDMGEEGELVSSYFARRMGWQEAQLMDYQKSLVATAKNANVTIDFSKRKHYFNTRKAHLLMHLAERNNKQEELNEVFINAYFSEGLDIGNTPQLCDLGEKVGLEKINIEAALSSDQLAQELDEKMERYEAYRLTSVPAFIVNNSVLISGANSVSSFEASLSKLIDT